MSKRERERTLAAGRKRLAEWGLGPEASVAELCAVFGRDPAADLAVVERLGAIPSEEALAALRELEPQASEKLLRREIHRSRFRLAQKGLVAPNQEETPVPTESRTPTLKAYLTDLRGGDIRCALLIRPQLGRCEAVYGLFTPDELYDCGLLGASEKRIIRVWMDSRREAGFEVFPADPRYVDFLLCRAELALRQRGAFPRESFLHLRERWFGRDLPGEMRCPIYELLDADAVRSDPTLLDRAQELAKERSFLPFLLDEFFTPYVEKALEARQSPLVLSELQIREREQDIVREALEAAFTGQQRERWIYRFEELAYAFHQLDKPELAKMSLAVALALREEPESHRNIPLLRSLVETALALQQQLRLAKEQEEAKERLVVPPSALRPPREPRPKP